MSARSELPKWLAGIASGVIVGVAVWAIIVALGHGSGDAHTATTANTPPGSPGSSTVPVTRPPTVPGASPTGPAVIVAAAGPAGTLHLSSNLAEARDGDTILLSGAGFLPGEEVYIHIGIKDLLDEGVIAVIKANSHGSFYNIPILLAGHDGGKVLTAHGARSGRSAETSIQIDK